MSGTRPPVATPIIRSRVPVWMLARDVILTLGAWMVIAHFFHEGLARAYDYFSPPMFELTRMSPPDWVYRWERLRGFLGAAAGLVLWMAFWAFDSRTRLRATSSPQPASLDAGTHARHVGLTVGELGLWRSLRVHTVDIDDTLQVTSRAVAALPTEPV